MENTTAVAVNSSISATPLIEYVYYAIALILGLLIIMSNLLLAAAICSSRKLRNESNNRILVAALAFSDVLLGFSYLTTSISFYLERSQFLTPLQCMCYVHVNLWFFGPILMPLFLCTISIDRLICVVSVSKYIDLGLRYLYLQICVPIVTAFTMYASAWVMLLVERRKNRISYICYKAAMLPAAYSDTFDAIQLSATVFAILVYILVMLIFHFHSAGVHGVVEVRKARENRITKTLGIMAAATFITYTCPVTVQTLVADLPTVFRNATVLNLINGTTSTVRAFHSFCNVLIYVSKEKDVRKRMYKLALSMVDLCRSAINGKPGLLARYSSNASQVVPMQNRQKNNSDRRLSHRSINNL